MEMLVARVAAVGAGKPIERSSTTLSDLERLVLDDYKLNGRKSIRRVPSAFRHLAAYFGKSKLVREITSEQITSYKLHRKAEKHRQGDGASSATVNRELAALKRGYSLAIEAGYLTSRPIIKLLSEDNARQGFVEAGDLARLLAELPGYLRG
ncbi:MAG TPA: phage integrase SAM-like domain-containing protein, partial [Candidatus Binataceae bacterium]|nr:phage integrase SAM-like domain-containing protein [Candidatus Binataceae bacterium]